MPSAERNGLLQAFETAIREIPSVRGVRAGKRVRLGTAYDARAFEPVDYFVAIEFDDAAGLRSYLQHPAHVELAERFGIAAPEAVAYDFALTSGVRALLDSE